MRYSLQSRFRGALLGAALGEWIGFQWQHYLSGQPFGRSPQVNGQWIEQWSLNPLKSKPDWSYGQIIVDGIRQLIERQRWDVATSQVSPKETTPGEATPGKADLDLDNAIESSGQSIRLKETVLYSRSQMGIMTALPIALFFHEDRQQLRDQLQQAIAVWHPHSNSTELVTAYWIPLYAIALALQDQLEPQRLISDLIEDLPLTESTEPKAAVQQLHQVAHWVAHHSSLFTLAQTVGRGDPTLTSSASAGLTPGAIALWSLLSTPHDFRLTLLQAARLGYHPHLTCALAGALSGAYNGLSGIPLIWRSILQHQPPQQSPLMALWTVTSETTLLKLSDQLLAVWAGALPAGLGGACEAVNDWQRVAIAAPNVIRPR